MSGLDEAKADFKKKNKRYHTLLNLFLAYAIILLTFVAIQTLVTQTTIARNQKSNAAASEERFRRYTEDNAVQHQKTQQYIRCIAQVLLLPIEQRTDKSFDSCSTSGVYDGKSSGSTSQPTSGSQPTAVPPQNQPMPQTTPSSQPVAAGSPPDDTPTPANDRSALGRLPLVGGLLNALGL